VRELFLLGGGQVHVARERHVLDHQREVGGCQTAEDPVDGRAGQILARQHGDVQRIGQRAEHAQEQTDVAVHVPEPQRVALHATAAVAAILLLLVEPLLQLVVDRRDVDQVLEVFLCQVEAVQVRHPRVVKLQL